MADKPAVQPAPRFADNGPRWPGIAALLAPAADCDCQMLAITINETIARARPLATGSEPVQN